MDRYEDKIIKNYNKLDSMNAVYDKKGIIF